MNVWISYLALKLHSSTVLTLNSMIGWFVFYNVIFIIKPIGNSRNITVQVFFLRVWRCVWYLLELWICLDYCVLLLNGTVASGLHLNISRTGKHCCRDCTGFFHPCIKKIMILPWPQLVHLFYKVDMGLGFPRGNCTAHSFSFYGLECNWNPTVSCHC